MLESKWLSLLHLAQKNKMPHALLLVGAKGAGKSALAHRLAKRLICLSPKEQGACGVCRACYLFEQKTHPDYWVLGEENTSIGIDDIRAVTTFLEQTPHGECKVVSFYQADKLSVAAGNALLKTLEEPPGQAFLILMAQSCKAVLPTLRSRCFIVNLPATARLVSQEKEGIALQKVFFGKGGTLDQKDIQQFITAKPQEALYLIYYWLSAFIRYYLQDTDFLDNPVENEIFQKTLGRVTLRDTFGFLEKVNEAIEILSLPGINKSLLFESLFYQWQSLSKMENT